MIRAILLPLFGLLTLPALAQVVVTVSTGSRFARRSFTERGIPGVSVRNVQACGTPGSRVTASEIVQGAARSNAILFAPGSLDLLSVRKSLAEVAADTAELAGLAGAFITGSVKMPPAEKTRAVTISAGAGLLAHWLATKLAPAQPAAPLARLHAMELPAEVVIPPSGCWLGVALGRD